MLVKLVVLKDPKAWQALRVAVEELVEMHWIWMAGRTENAIGNVVT